MAEITASLVKQLRESTGAGMMDCKKALSENNGDIEAATDWLRTKGISAAAKKSGRVTAEGLVAVTVSGNKGAIIELNSETDFVARNEQFQQLAGNIATLALENGNDFEALQSTNYPESGRTVTEEITENIAVIGENLSLRRAASLEVSQGTVIQYIHNKVSDGLGKIGVLVALESSADIAALDELGKQIAMHIAAARPQALTIEEVDPQALQREKDIFSEQARESGKPDNIIEKMVEGRIRKYYEEVVLLEQAFVIDGKTKIAAVVEEKAKELGTAITLKAFVRFELGEGIEKRQDDFASEVAAAAGN